jgi:hypothetical protein
VVEKVAPGLDGEQRGELAEKVYPLVYDGSLVYVGMNTRQMRVWGESAIGCAFNAIIQATKDKSYACKSTNRLAQNTSIAQSIALLTHTPFRRIWCLPWFPQSGPLLHLRHPCHRHAPVSKVSPTRHGQLCPEGRASPGGRKGIPHLR